MLNEKGLCKILKSAYKGGGYQIIPQTVKVIGPAGAWKRSDIVINGATWAVRCETTDLPKAAAVQIVDDAGYLPVEAIGIRKGEENQLILEGIAADQKIPVILIACVNGQTIAINGEVAKEVADFYETLYNCALKLENDANS